MGWLWWCMQKWIWCNSLITLAYINIFKFVLVDRSSQRKPLWPPSAGTAGYQVTPESTAGSGPLQSTSEYPQLGFGTRLLTMGVSFKSLLGKDTVVQCAALVSVRVSLRRTAQRDEKLHVHSFILVSAPPRLWWTSMEVKGCQLCLCPVWGLVRSDLF